MGKKRAAKIPRGTARAKRRHDAGKHASQCARVCNPVKS